MKKFMSLLTRPPPLHGSDRSRTVLNTAAKNNTRPAPVKLRTPTIKVKSSAKKKAQIIWNLKGNGVKYQVYYSTKKNKGYKKAKTGNL